MPKRRYARRRFRRKRTYKRKKRNYRVARPRYTPSGTQPYRTFKFRICQAGVMASQAGLLVGREFSCNSLFNPTKSSLINPQPMGFDQASQLFQHYTVIGSKAMVSFTPTTTSPADQAWCGIHLTDEPENTEYVSYTGYIEAQKGTYTNVMQPRNAPKMLTCTFSPKSWFNITDIKDNKDLGAPMAENPDRQCFFKLWYQPTSTDNIRKAMNFTITIDYIAVLSDPVELSRS